MKYAAVLLLVIYLSKSFVSVGDMVSYLNRMPKDKQNMSRIDISTSTKNNRYASTTYRLTYPKWSSSY